MLSLECSHPEHFDELCALAAGGQVSEAEFIELQDHLEQCARCRSVYTEFIDLLHHKLPLAAPEVLGSRMPAGLLSNPSSYRERFLARARKEGLAVSQASRRDLLRSKLRILCWPELAIASLAAAVGVLGYGLHQSNGEAKMLAARIAALSEPTRPQASSEKSGEKAEPKKRLPDETDAALAAGLTVKAATDTKLEKARQDHAAAETHSRDLEAQLQAAAKELENLRAQDSAQNKEAGDLRSQLEAKLANAEEALNRAGGELRRIRQARSDDAVKLAAQSLDIRTLSEKLSAQQEILDRERTLLAADRDIHDLMGARNLHIVDVLDVDSKGKDRRPFGRVFYTEGKSLIFYAFDLGDSRTQKRNASFQVWGAHGGAQTSAQNMGIFYVDDQKQNRWVLKFEDPRLLAEIDSVFVTIEPPGGSQRPTGRRFLYAYLKANPNHP